MMFAV